MLGIRIDTAGHPHNFVYHSLQDLENHTRLRGDVFIPMETFPYNNGYYRFYGYATGNSIINHFDLQTCMAIGDLLLLRFNTYDEPCDVDWEEFLTMYEDHDDLDELLIEDELGRTISDDYERDGFVVSDDSDDYEEAINNIYSGWRFLN